MTITRSDLWQRAVKVVRKTLGGSVTEYERPDHPSTDDFLRAMRDQASREEQQCIADHVRTCAVCQDKATVLAMQEPTSPEDARQNEALKETLLARFRGEVTASATLSTPAVERSE